MGKAARTRQQAAQAKIAAQREASRRTDRRRQGLIVAGSILAVLVIVVTLIVIKTASQPAPPGSATRQSNSSVAAKVTSVPSRTLDRVGKGALGTSAFPGPLITISGPPLSAGGKPEVLYMGAEYCPYCATERWAIAVTLSRFGTFSGLRFIHSDPNDVPASIPTLTFYRSRYISKYLTFTPVEMQNINRSPLQTPTPAQRAILSKYDKPPYVPAASAGSIPFIDLGNRYMISGASYSYTVLQGHTWSQIAAALHDPATAIAQGADGTANYLTAAICKLTGNQPASACTPVVRRLETHG
jgi:thiol-disulfide isomerase/thioredoxin